MKIKKALYILMFLLLCLNSNAQTASGLDSLGYRLEVQKNLYPQEKIYLHMDKPHYVSGEKVWFRSYLVDAFSLIPKTESRYMYVELVSPANTVVDRIKIRRDKETFSGYLQLADTLAEGNYTICAYTMLMCSASENYFFKKNIYVSNPLLQALSFEAGFEYNETGNKVKVKLSLKDHIKQVRLMPKSLRVTLGKENIEFYRNTSDSLYYKTLKANSASSGELLYVKTGNLCQYIPIPANRKEFEVSFFPEGGYLVPDTLCRIGFKSLNNEGASESFTGELYDSDQRLVTSFTPIYKGIGAFYYRPENGKQYYAVCRTADGLVKRFNLPEPETRACVLSVNQTAEDFLVSIKSSSSLPDYDGKKLVVHSRGQIFYASVWNRDNKYIRFRKSMFPSGVLQFLLLDKGGEALSERLVFCLNEDHAVASVHTDRKNYGKRERIHSRVNVQDRSGNRLSGTFSVSVIDEGVVRKDTCNSILTSLLLDSELRGPVESPAYYFRKIDRYSTAALDALMLTQGWRRYNLPAVLQGKYEKPVLEVEAGAEIAGSVLSLSRNKPLPDSFVSLIAMDGSYCNSTTTDSGGRYHFNGFEWPDSTKFVLQALNKRGNDFVKLTIDSFSYPRIKGLATADRFIKPKELEQFNQKAGLKTRLENGMLSVWLDEVVAIGQKKIPSYYQSVADLRFSSKKIESISATTLMEILRRIPGCSIKDDKAIRIRRAPLPPLVVIDGVAMNDPRVSEGIKGDTKTPFNEFDYSTVDMHDVENINVFYVAGSTVIWGPGGGGGVIEITTKKGWFQNAEPAKTNLKQLSPLGFQKPAEFYSPKYETPKEKTNPETDLRTTIYWNPKVSFSPSKQGDFSFYSSDFETDYGMLIEGVTDNGKIIHEWLDIPVTDN